MIDYEKVDKLVENCKNLYPDIPDYCLWVLACDYYINESRDDDEDEDEDILAQEGSPARRENTRARDTKEKQERLHSRAHAREQLKKDALEAFNKAQEEFKKTKYENIKVV